MEKLEYWLFEKKLYMIIVFGATILNYYAYGIVGAIAWGLVWAFAYLLGRVCL